LEIGPPTPELVTATGLDPRNAPHEPFDGGFEVGASEPFSSCFDLVNLQYEDGLGDLSCAPGTAA
jgi:hypothetical protein